MKDDHLQDLETALLHLPASDRSRLASRLIDSLDEEGPEISPEWLAEVDERARDLDEGNGVPVPASVVWRQVNERFGTSY